MYRVLLALGMTVGLLFALMFALRVPNINLQQPLPINIGSFVQDERARITSGYCERVRNGHHETHPGVDIAVISGTRSLPMTVTAGITGHVEVTYPFTGHHYSAAASRSDWLHNFNTVVISDATSHNFFLYAHFSRIMAGIAASTTVTPGTPIGIIGGMGAACTNTFGNHLHLEIREDVGTSGWGNDELDLVTSGSKKHAISPTLQLGPNMSVTVPSKADEKGGGMYSYSYGITNDLTSYYYLPVEVLRIGYKGMSPYTVTSAPDGWAYSTWDENPDWVWFYADAPTAAVGPGATLTGFAYVSLDPPGQVPFFVAYDDAGHGGGLGPTEVTVLGASAKPPTYLPIIRKNY